MEPRPSKGKGSGRVVRCRRTMGRQGDPSLTSRLLSSCDLGSGLSQCPHLHITNVSGSSPSWLTPVLGSQLVKGDGVTGGPSLVCPEGLVYGLCVAEGVGGEGCFVCFELQGAFLPLVPPLRGGGWAGGEMALAHSPLHGSRWSPATPSPAPAGCQSLCFPACEAVTNYCLVLLLQ